MFNKISVVGLGYIGLPTAAFIASKGIEVIGVDVNEHAVNTINEGRIHIVEPGLEEMVKDDVEKGLLKAYLTPQSADAFLIAVPTPFKGDDYEPNLDYIESASKAIAPVLKSGDLVILESTSPVGATEKMAAWIAQARPELKVSGINADSEVDIFVAHCPERVLPGHVIRELEENDRVIGGLNDASTERATALYKTFVKGECIATNARTAEMAKLTENASRDVQIAFANELSMICDKQGINVWELIELANRHPRVNILQPGAGVGGHCIAVDPWFIVNQNPEEAKLIHQARKINDFKPDWVIEKIEAAVAGIENPTIACLGLAFKPDIDDLRESPALQITEKLAAKGYKVLAVEPNVEALPKSLVDLDNVQLVSLDDAIARANTVGVLVKHREFSGLRPGSKLLDFVDALGQ
jgi:UDP-N-acetyl-D-mannosaminuronic acid dehydrogenase